VLLFTAVSVKIAEGDILGAFEVVTVMELLAVFVPFADAVDVFDPVADAVTVFEMMLEVDSETEITEDSVRFVEMVIVEDPVLDFEGRIVSVLLADAVCDFDDVEEAVLVVVPLSERVVVVEDVAVFVDDAVRVFVEFAEAVRDAFPVDVTVRVRKMVGVFLPVFEPDEELVVVFDARTEYVADGEEVEVRDARVDSVRVGVPVEDFVFEVEDVAVLLLVAVFVVEIEPVAVAVNREVVDIKGDEVPDLVPTEVRVPVLVDVAVLLDRAVTVVTAVPTSETLPLDDLVDVFVGIEVDDATTAVSTNPRAILSLLSVNCGSAAVAPHENARSESNKKRMKWRRVVEVKK